MNREAMQLALDMLNEIADDVYCDQKLEGAITALRLALEKQWVGLTDEAVFELADTNLYDGGKNYGVLAFAKAIEQALKEKNNG